MSTTATKKEILFVSDFITLVGETELTVSTRGSYIEEENADKAFEDGRKLRIDLPKLTKNEADSFNISQNASDQLYVVSRYYRLIFKSSYNKDVYYHIGNDSKTSINFIKDYKKLGKNLLNIELSNGDTICIDKMEVNSTKGFTYRVGGLSNDDLKNLQQNAHNSTMLSLKDYNFKASISELEIENYMALNYYQQKYTRILSNLIQENSISDKTDELEGFQKKMIQYPLNVKPYDY